MRLRLFLRRCLRERGGATIIEFAVVAPVFFMLILAGLEYGLVMFTRIAIESATAEVSRTSSLGAGIATPGCDQVCTVSNLIQEKTLGLVTADRVIVSASLVPADAAAATVDPDICITDPPSAPATCDPPLTYIDNNHNNAYDPPGAVNLGTVGDLVEIRATYLWTVNIPLVKYAFGNGDGQVVISSSTVIKNEP